MMQAKDQTKRRTGLPLLGAGLAVALLVGACSDGSEDSAPTTAPADSTDDGAASDGGTSAAGESEPIAFESPSADDVDLQLPSIDELVDARPAAILDVGGTDGAELIVSFEMESHHCHGVRARADETDTEVILSIETGLLPNVDPTSCRYGVYPYTTSVTLTEPLGERTITTELREPATPTERSGDASVGELETVEPAGAADPIDPEVTDPDDRDPSDPTAPSPIERGGPTVAIDDAAQLIGVRVEDGVEWAITHGVEWRILSYDGAPTAEPSPFDATRISFVVDRDLIVRFEWS